MKLKFLIATLVVMAASFAVPLPAVYADRDGRREYRHYRYYPRDHFYHRRIYYFPSRRYYYYYDVLPSETYYYEVERNTATVNPNYLSITSIAHMASQGVPESVIIDEIRRTNSTYTLTSETITYLRQNGVTDKAINVMLGR